MASDGAFIGYLPNGDCSSPFGGPALHTPDGTLTPLPLNGTTASNAYVYGMNASHVVLGSLNGMGPVEWQPGGQPVQLSTLLPNNSGWTLQTAAAINDNGDIVGTGMLGGVEHGFLLQTAPLVVQIKALGSDGQPYGSGQTGVGKTLVAQVTVTNNSTTGSVSAITVNPPLSVAPSASLTKVSGPSPAAPNGTTTLSPGQSLSYSITYTVAATGDAVLSAQASGSTGGSIPVQSTGSLRVHLSPPLSVAVAYLQNKVPVPKSTIKLADNDAGEIPQAVDVKVTITNISGVEQDNVSVNGTPALSFANLANANRQVPAAITAGPEPGYADREACARRLRRDRLHVDGDRQRIVRALAAGAVLRPSSRTNVSQGRARSPPCRRRSCSSASIPRASPPRW